MEKVTAKTIETEVAEAILQQPMGVVTLRGIEYTICHPSPATLIMVSQLCADLPPINGKGNVLTETLRIAKDSAVIGKIIATLILGAKRVKENKMIEITRTRSSRSLWRRFFGLPDKQTVVTEKVAEIDYFAEMLLEEISPAKMNEIALDLFAYSEIADFFALSTSLSVANLLKRTKEVGTASGDWS